MGKFISYELLGGGQEDPNRKHGSITNIQFIMLSVDRSGKSETQGGK